MTNNIDKVIEKELENIKEIRKEDRKKKRKPKYTNFAVKCLFKTEFEYKNNKVSFIRYVINKDKTYQKILTLLLNSEYILNRSYTAKLVSEWTEYSLSTIYSKIDELVELNVLEYIDSSIRITRVALREIFNIDIDTINYKKDTKQRSKLKINMVAKGYRLQRQNKYEKILEEELMKNHKIIILNEEEFLLLHKDGYTAIQEGKLTGLLLEINQQMCKERLKAKGINYDYLSLADKDKVIKPIKKVYVTTKRSTNHNIAGVKTELLEDIIDYSEYKKK